MGNANISIIYADNNDTLSGQEGTDILMGGLGDDTLYGGEGADTFVFADDWGHDTVADFENGVDVIDMTGVSGLTSFDQLSITSKRGDVHIAFGDDVITLEHTPKRWVDASDFVFDLA